jgi:outer membrane phospholipase A
VNKWNLLLMVALVPFQNTQASSTLDWLASSAGNFFRAECRTDNPSFPRCLTGDEPSYFAVIPRVGDHYDTHHLEFNLSVKTPLLGLQWDSGRNTRSLGLYFSYTGMYDFYAGTRYSSPVVSRKQNPGAFLKYAVERSHTETGFKSVRLGWFHESNGQDIDNPDLYQAKLNELELKNGELTEFDYLTASDNLSRGWDYAQTTLKYTFADQIAFFNSNVITDIYFNWRFYYCDCQGAGYAGDSEEYYDWATGIDKEPTAIGDYKRLKFIINRSTKNRSSNFERREWSNLLYWAEIFMNYTRYSLVLESGYDPSTISWKAQFTAMLGGQFPLTVFYFNGYGENLSTYHRRTSYYGIGIELW